MQGKEKVTGPLFWNFSTDPEKQAASQAVLIQAYFNICGKKLVKPSDPFEQVVIESPDYEEEREIDTLKEMSRAPSKRFD